jgi:hypothetical protein
MRLARELHERRQDLFARLMGRLESGALAAVIDGLHMAAGALEAAAHTAGAGPTD